jgi:hypothetical protein
MLWLRVFMLAYYDQIRLAPVDLCEHRADRLSADNMCMQALSRGSRFMQHVIDETLCHVAHLVPPRSYRNFGDAPFAYAFQVGRLVGVNNVTLAASAVRPL